jgi:hypothetical protein
MLEIRFAIVRPRVLISSSIRSFENDPMLRQQVSFGGAAVLEIPYSIVDIQFEGHVTLGQLAKEWDSRTVYGTFRTAPIETILKEGRRSVIPELELCDFIDIAGHMMTVGRLRFTDRGAVGATRRRCLWDGGSWPN